MQPYLVSDILAPDGSVLQHNAPVCKRQVIQPATSAAMREMMEAVVLYGGCLLYTSAGGILCR